MIARSTFAAAAFLLLFVCNSTGSVSASPQCPSVIEPAPPPGVREGFGLAYDSGRGVSVLFGGFHWIDLLPEPTLFDDTWEWDGTEWTLRDTPGPHPTHGGPMTFDSIRNVVVLYSSHNVGPTLIAETWEWDGVAWNQRVVAGPPPRFGTALSFDAARGVTVLFGGEGQGTLLSDTWEWDGTSWTARLVSGPLARSFHALAFDAARQRTVMFGGRAANLSPVGDTWEWDGTTWSLSAMTGPSPRYEHFLVYDGIHTRILLSGGSSESSELWSWSGSAWSMVEGGGHFNGSVRGAVFDQQRSMLVLMNVLESSWSVVERLETWEWDGAVWRQTTPGCRDWEYVAPRAPGVLWESKMVFDQAREVAVLFGGGSYSGSNETWEWNGTSWTMRVGPAPQPRNEHAMAYDSLRGVSVMFGGWESSSGSRFGDTWEWNGTVWTRRAEAGPGVRQRHSMAFDGTRGVTVLFGGSNVGQKFGDTWEWDGVAWVLRSLSGPPPSDSTAMAFDSGRGVCVLAGLVCVASVCEIQTWEWDGSAWVLRDASPSAGFTSNLLAYDSIRGVTVRMSGVYQAGVTNWGTWEWDGTSWNLASVSGPPPSTDITAVTFDSVRQRTLGYGSGNGLADIWEWDGVTWTVQSIDPSARSGQAMAYDSIRERTVLFGGSWDGLLGDTWEWDGSTWVLRATSGPSARSGHAMAFDRNRGRTVLFGGRAGASFLVDTWEWDGTAWNQVSSSGPSPRASHVMVFDEARGVVVLFGGYFSEGLGSTTQPFADTWEWNGSIWTQRSVPGPLGRASHAAAYDMRRQVTVVHGGWGVEPQSKTGFATLQDTWEWDGAHWTLRCADTPILRQGLAMAFDRDTGVTVLFSGLESDITIPDTWEWNGVIWHQTQALGPRENYNHSMVYDEARKRIFVYGGEYNFGENWDYGCRCAGSAGPPISEPRAGCVGSCYATKNRYLSIVPPYTPCGATATALRVTMGPMPGANNCPNVPDFSAFDGTQMWVGPERIVFGSLHTGVHALQSTPHFDTWGNSNGVLQISDCNIVPCATYTIEAIADTDYPAGPFSAPLVLNTSRVWGDVIGSGGVPGNGVVDGLDVVAIVDRFKNVFGAPPRTWCDLQGDSPIQGVLIDVDGLDISSVVDSFKGIAYPFPGPSVPLKCPGIP